MSKKKTKERVLEKACEIFAEKGFRNTTVADICKAAGANIAAVNYYFKNKEDLYHEVWKLASELNENTYKASEPKKTDSEKWLRDHIRSRVLSITNPGPSGWLPRLLQREIADPSAMSDKLRKEFIMPRKKQLDKAVKLLLGPKATKQQVMCCSINILSLYAFLNIGRFAREHLFGGKNPTKQQKETVIRQMQDFSVSAVNGVRESIIKGKTR